MDEFHTFFSVLTQLSLENLDVFSDSPLYLAVTYRLGGNWMNLTHFQREDEFGS